jgi:hypothetical protein
MSVDGDFYACLSIDSKLNILMLKYIILVLWNQFIAVCTFWLKNQRTRYNVHKNVSNSLKGSPKDGDYPGGAYIWIQISPRRGKISNKFPVS